MVILSLLVLSDFWNVENCDVEIIETGECSESRTYRRYWKGKKKI